MRGLSSGGVSDRVKRLAISNLARTLIECKGRRRGDGDPVERAVDTTEWIKKDGYKVVSELSCGGTLINRGLRRIPLSYIERSWASATGII